MNLQTYQSKTMAEALAQVRRELGKEAVILNTRTFKRGGLFGIGGKRVVEITATAGINVLHPKARRHILSGGTAEPSAGAKPEAAMNDRLVLGGVKQSSQHDQLRQELALVKEMVQQLVQEHQRGQHPAVPEELFATYLSLINQQVGQEVADEIIRQVKQELSTEQFKDEKLVRRSMAKCIEKMIPTAGPLVAGQAGKPRVIALVGPTGVGKTTTIAKLAANFKLRENKNVGLITIDTYRIGAVEQLRTYADIINVPLRVVLSPDELREAVQQMQDCHLILIDTAGRSQNDDIKLRELKSFLKSANPAEVHLVLSTTSDPANIQACIQRFSLLGIDKVIFTKLDEAVGFGMLLSASRKLDRAISYITTGQSVPNDIEPGSSRQLAKLLMDRCEQDVGKGKQEKAAVKRGA